MAAGIFFQFAGKLTPLGLLLVGALALFNYYFLTDERFKPARYKASAADVHLRGINEMVGFIAPGFRFTRSAPQLDALVAKSRLFENFKKIEFVREYGCIAGRMGAADVAIVLTRAGYYREVTETIGNRKVKRKVEEICFDGYLVLADFPRKFDGWVTLAPDHIESRLGWLATEWRELRDQFAVRLENQDFEREFVVRASDPVVAHYVLSASTIEDVLNLKRRLGERAMMGAFFESTLMLAIPEAGTKFALNGDEPTAWLASCEEDAFRLQSMLRVLADMKVGETIWRPEERAG